MVVGEEGKNVMPEVSPPLTCYVLVNVSQYKVSLHHCTCTLLIHVQFNFSASTHLSSAMLLPSQSVPHPSAFAMSMLFWKINKLLCPNGIRSQISHKILLPKSPPQTRILFYSSPSRVSVLLLAFFIFLRTLNSTISRLPLKFLTCSSLVKSRPSTMLAWSACLVLVSENCPQQTEKYGLLVICHVNASNRGWDSPSWEPGLTGPLVSHAACLCVQRLKLGPQSSSFHKGTWSPFVTTSCAPLLPRLSAGFGLHSLTKLAWRPPLQVTAPLAKISPCPTSPKTVKIFWTNSLILHEFLHFIWEHTKRFKMIHHFSSHLIWNQVIDL